MQRREFTRRDILKFAAAGAVTPSRVRFGAGEAVGKVVVIGGGFGGATAAKHLRMWSPGSR